MKLYYFQVRLRAETIRIALELANADYEDNYVKDHETWMSLNRTYGQLPILVLDDGSVLTQSRTILSYVGRRFGLYPTDFMEAARVDELIDSSSDVEAEIGKAGVTDEEKRNGVLAGLVGVCGRWLKVWESLIKDKEHFVGQKHSIADVAVFRVLEELCDEVPEALKEYPELDRFRNAFKSIEGVNSYFNSGRRNVLPKSAKEVAEMWSQFGPIIRGAAA